MDIDGCIWKLCSFSHHIRRNYCADNCNFLLVLLTTNHAAMTDYFHGIDPPEEEGPRHNLHRNILTYINRVLRTSSTFTLNSSKAIASCAKDATEYVLRHPLDL